MRASEPGVNRHLVFVRFSIPPGHRARLAGFGRTAALSTTECYDMPERTKSTMPPVVCIEGDRRARYVPDGQVTGGASRVLTDK